MVINHTHPQARYMWAVDPKTSEQIEHVKAIDPDVGWLEVWCTYKAAEGHNSLWLEGGQTVERDYMLLRMTDFEGNTTYMSRVDYRDFDVIDKRTGEVLYEVRQPVISSDAVDAEASPGAEEPSSARSF